MSTLGNRLLELYWAQQQKKKDEPYYEVLEYIQLDGTQYFNLGFKSDLNTAYEIGVQFNDLSSTGCGVCGSRGPGTPAASINNIGTFVGTLTNLVSDFNNSSYVNTRFLCPKTSVNTIDWYDCYNSKTSRGIKKDGIDVVTPNTVVCTDTFTTQEDFYLGKYVNDLNLPPFKGKIRYFKCSSPSMDLIPVLDRQMIPCFYDRISKRFFYHQNSSGSTIPTYKRWNKFDVDYIESSGTQYIDLAGIVPTETMGMSIEYAYVASGSSESTGILGTFNGDATPRRDTFFVSSSSGTLANNSGVMVFHRGGNTGTSSTASDAFVQVETDKWYSAQVNWMNSGTIEWTDGDKELTANVGRGAIRTNALRLFSRYNANSNSGTYSMCKARCRSLKFSNGSQIIRSFQPVVWHNGNDSAIACMYDEVYNKMYTNAGTGSFKAYIAYQSTKKINVFTTTGSTSGKFINAEGQMQSNSSSSYSALLPIVGGTVVECISGNVANNNYRYHSYDANGNWLEQSLVLMPTTTEPITGSFTAPVNAKYVRVSYVTTGDQSIEVQSMIDMVYEVGAHISGSPAGVSGASNCFDTGIYGNENMQVKLLSITLSSVNMAGQLFGSYDGSLETSKNLTINSVDSSNPAPIRFDGQTLTTTIKVGINKKISIIDNKRGIWVNDTLHGSWGQVLDFITPTSLFILKANGSSNVRPNGCCYCTIEENFKLIAEYIPVRDAANNTVFGLFDRVSGKLNRGIGTLTFNALS